MKNITCVLLMSAALLSLFTGCKKNNDDAKDYSALIKNTIWSGEMKYANKAYVEPFSMNCKADGSFVWHEFSGNLSGTYTIDNQKGNVSIVFSNGRIFSAHITDDKKLSNFEYGQTDWELKNAELNTLADQALDNTVWSGNYSNGGAYSITFKPNSKVNVQAYPSTADQNYFRINGAIRYEGNDFLYYWKFFCVLQNNNTIKGIKEIHAPIENTYSYLPFMVSKK